MDTLPAVINMEWCYGRSNTEKESLKELTLTPTLTLNVTQTLTLTPTLTLTLTITPQTNYFGSDSRKSFHFDIIMQ